MKLLASAQHAVDAIVSYEGSRTYDSTLGALEGATEALERAMATVGHLESVATTDALREAYNAVVPKVSAFWSELAMNEGLYGAVRSFSETPEAAALDPTRRRFLQKTLDDFRRHGAELAPEDKARLQAMEVELTQLTTTFSQNVLDETNAFELVITDEDKLAGIAAERPAGRCGKRTNQRRRRLALHAPSPEPDPASHLPRRSEDSRAGVACLQHTRDFGRARQPVTDRAYSRATARES